MQDAWLVSMTLLTLIVVGGMPVSYSHILGGDVSLSVMAAPFIYRLISPLIFPSAVFPRADDIGVTLHFIDSCCQRSLVFLCQVAPHFPEQPSREGLRMKGGARLHVFPSFLLLASLVVELFSRVGLTCLWFRLSGWLGLF